MKLYTFVVHYLQMCMKEYGCCPKFKRRDNSAYTFTKRGWGGMYLVSAVRSLTVLVIIIFVKLCFTVSDTMQLFMLVVSRKTWNPLFLAVKLRYIFLQTLLSVKPKRLQDSHLMLLC